MTGAPQFADAETGDDGVARRLAEAAQRALAEARQRRLSAAPKPQREFNGRGGLEPVRYGDWEVKGLASDF